MLPGSWGISERENTSKSIEMRISVTFWQLPVVYCGWRVGHEAGESGRVPDYEVPCTLCQGICCTVVGRQ